MKLRCFGCGGAVSNELPPDTIVRALILCRECTADAVLRVTGTGPLVGTPIRSKAQEEAHRVREREQWGAVAKALEPPPPPPTHDPNELLRTEQAADILRVDRRTLDTWRWRGEGPRYIKIGRAVRYRRGELMDFIAKRELGSTAENPK